MRHALLWFRYPFAGCSWAEPASVLRNEKSITCIIDKSNRKNSHGTKNQELSNIPKRVGELDQNLGDLNVCSTTVRAADPFFSNPQTWATFGDARIEEWDNSVNSLNSLRNLLVFIEDFGEEAKSIRRCTDPDRSSYRLVLFF